MNITNASIIRLAKLGPKEQKYILDQNPDANYSLMVEKCKEISEQQAALNNHELSIKLDDLKFLAGLYKLKKIHGSDAVEIEVYETQQR